MDSKKLTSISDKANQIYIDVDGVLFASNEAMCTLLNRIYHKHHKGSEVTDWNYTNLYPTNSEEIERLFASKEFFDNVRLIRGAKTYLTKYREKIVIITKGTTANFVRKRWLFNQLGFEDIPIIPIPFNVSKGIINMKGGLFIDDCTNNLKESNAKYKVMFMEYNDGKEREWQMGWNKDRLYDWRTE